MFGYLSIFLAGQGVGLDILPDGPPSSSIQATAYQKRKDLVKRLGIWLAGWYALFYISTSVGMVGLRIQASRRLANAPYVEWVVMFNCMQLLLYCLVETIVFPDVYKANTKDEARRAVNRATSRVLNAYNRNGLVIFLIANLLTGAVNLGVDTLNASTTKSMLVLAAYSATVTAVAVGLDAWDISVKL